MGATGGGEDNLISRLIAEDKTPWYKKPNLRLLYFLMFPTCIGIEMTSGYVPHTSSPLKLSSS